MTLSEILKERGYTKKQRQVFYRAKDRLTEMSVRLTVEAWESMDKEGMDRRGI